MRQQAASDRSLVSAAQSESLEDRMLLAAFSPNDVDGLIAAINTANTNGEVDTIDLGGQTFTLMATDNVDGSYADSGLPVIAVDSGNELTISNGTIERDGSASDTFRLLFNDGTLILDTVTIRGGEQTFGGGVLNQGNLTVRNSIVTGNTGDTAGGLYNVVGTMTVENSIVTGNTAANIGGGLFASDGAVSVVNSLISGNTASGNGDGRGNGGGIANYGTLVVRDSTLSENTAGGNNGGGIYNKGTLLVKNSTLSGNSAGAFGGGIANDGLSNGVATINNSTISGNTARYDGGGIGDNGTITISGTTISGNEAGYGAGGIQLVGNSGTINNSIVTGNVGGDFAHFGGTASGNNNLSDDGTVPGHIAAVTFFDPVLRDNGGPTLTHALFAGSNAIDAGDNSLLPADSGDADGDDNTSEVIPFDQRGSGFARIHDETVDIGAFEVQAPAADSFEVTIAADVVDSEDGETSLREAIIAANASGVESLITFDESLNGTPIVLSIRKGKVGEDANATGDLDISSTITIQGAGSGVTTIDGNGTDGANDRVFHVLNGGNLTVDGVTVTGGASENGAGLQIDDGGQATVRYSTIVGNSGYGVSNSSATTTLSNTIIAGNAVSDVKGDFLGSNNLVEDGTGRGVAATTAITGDPMLGPLQDNGGPTFTHAPVADSPAVDAGDNSNALDADGVTPLTTDQRGFEPRIVGGTVDIGAFEVGAFDPTPDSFIVTTATDENDGTTAPGTGSGTSLREAIIAANANPNPSTITFDPNLNSQSVRLTITGDGDEQGDLNIFTDVTITGNGLANTVLDASELGDRVLRVRNGGSLTISDVTITGGSAGFGGGILNVDGAVSIADSAITGNTVQDTGGGVASYGGTLTIVNTTISGNTSETTNANYGGGGVRVDNSAGHIFNSTISSNMTNGTGDGIQHSSYGNQSFLVANTTISGNSAGGKGGGLRASSDDLSVANSTITGNTSGTDGGGLYSGSSIDSVTNTIVAGNFGPGQMPNDIGNGPGIGSRFLFSIIGDAATADGATHGTNNNIVGNSGTGTLDINNLLGPLTDNGGPTLTHLLVSGSVAIDAGDNNAIPVDAGDQDGDSDTNEATPFDQRGVGADRVFDGGDSLTVDIGAFEFRPADSFVVTTATDENDGSADPGTGTGTSLREAVIAANADLNESIITFSSDLNGTDIALSLGGVYEYAALTGDLDITSRVTITGNGSANTVVDAGGADGLGDRVLGVLASGNLTLNLQGSDVGGSEVDRFRVFVKVDDGATVEVPLSNIDAGEADGSDVHTATTTYQGLRDGASHTYTFFTRGVDDAGNLEDAPDDATADLQQTHTFAAPASISATGIDVQNGQTQRSYVREVDVLFNDANGLQSLIDNDQIRVERFDLTDSTPDAGTGPSVAISGATISGNSIKLDFGSDGLGGVGRAGNGFYRILVDEDGDGTFDDAHFEFFRLWADANGDGKITSADRRVSEDLTGNGVVNAKDRSIWRRERSFGLLDDLFDLLDD